MIVNLVTIIVKLVTMIVKLVTMIVKYNYVNLTIELNDITKQKMIEINFIEYS